MLGVLHLDSQERINAFTEKDLSLVRAMSHQTALVIQNLKLIQDVQKEVRIREGLGRFLPPHVVNRVMTTGENQIRKGGRQTTGTIMFADIRGFTEFSERCSPQEVVDLLNDFFERLVEVVFKFDGVLDKYIGDCLMAAFGTLPNQNDPIFSAVAAALGCIEAVEEMNAERIRVGKQAVKIGIGLHSGQMVSGFIGSSQRLEYTCIGDTVNTASRICSLAKDNEVLISAYTYFQVHSRIHAVCHTENMKLKGKKSTITLYKVTAIQ